MTQMHIDYEEIDKHMRNVAGGHPFLHLEGELAIAYSKAIAEGLGRKDFFSVLPSASFLLAYATTGYPRENVLPALINVIGSELSERFTFRCETATKGNPDGMWYLGCNMIAYAILITGPSDTAQHYARTALTNINQRLWASYKWVAEQQRKIAKRESVTEDVSWIKPEELQTILQGFAKSGTSTWFQNLAPAPIPLVGDNFWTVWMFLTGRLK